MKLNEQLEQLRKLRATEEQQTRIYEKITTERPKKAPTWQPFAAICSVIAIMLFLLTVETKDVVTSGESIRYIAYMTDEKHDLLFPLELYSNTTVITNDVFIDKMERILTGEDATEAIPQVDETLWIGKSKSYIYVEGNNGTYTFLYEGMALYDVDNRKRYALSVEEEDILLSETLLIMPPYYFVMLLLFFLWQMVVEAYYKLRKRKRKSIREAPKKWQGILYITWTLEIGLMFVMLYSEAVIFKGYGVLLLIAASGIMLYICRFITEDRIDDITYTITALLQFVLMLSILWIL